MRVFILWGSSERPNHSSELCDLYFVLRNHNALIGDSDLNMRRDVSTAGEELVKGKFLRHRTVAGNVIQLQTGMTPGGYLLCRFETKRPSLSD